MIIFGLIFWELNIWAIRIDPVSLIAVDPNSSYVWKSTVKSWVQSSNIILGMENLPCSMQINLVLACVVIKWILCILKIYHDLQIKDISIHGAWNFHCFALILPADLKQKISVIMGPQNHNVDDAWCWEGCVSGTYLSKPAYLWAILHHSSLQQLDESFQPVWHLKMQVFKHVMMFPTCILPPFQKKKNMYFTTQYLNFKVWDTLWCLKKTCILPTLNMLWCFQHVTPYVVIL